MTTDKKQQQSKHLKFIRAHVLIDGLKLFIKDFELEDETGVNDFFQSHLKKVGPDHSLSTGTDVCYGRG